MHRYIKPSRSQATAAVAISLTVPSTALLPPAGAEYAAAYCLVLVTFSCVVGAMSMTVTGRLAAAATKQAVACSGLRGAQIPGTCRSPLATHLLRLQPSPHPRPYPCPAPTVACNTAGQASFAMNFLLLFSLVFTGFLVNVDSIPGESIDYLNRLVMFWNLPLRCLQLLPGDCGPYPSRHPTGCSCRLGHARLPGAPHVLPPQC